MAKINIRWAVTQALDEEMARDEKVFLIGEDIGASGGSFGETRGLFEKYGEWRVRDTAISEEALIGSAFGAAMAGYRPVAEIMFMDFIPAAIEYIINQAAQTYYLSNNKIKVPMVVRTIGGGGFRAGAHHSQSLEALFTNSPGVKVIYVSNAYDAKGLLKAAIRDDNPVLFIEPKALLGMKSEVPEEEYVIPIGKAAVKREGKDVTLITYGRMVHTCLDAAKLLEEAGIDAEVIDLRTLQPWDKEAVFNSVRKTNRAAVVYEGRKDGGFGAEVSASIAESLIFDLDAPVLRFATEFLPIPAGEIEDVLYPSAEGITAGIKGMF